MLPFRRAALVLLLAGSASAPAADPPATAVVQDFEGAPEIGTWPETGRATVTTAWAADGTHSLLIAPGTQAAIAALAVTDWSGYQIWRLHVNVPGSHGAVLGLELADTAGGKAFHDRHQNSAAAPPGVSVVDVDIAGDLWRGEINRPYRLLKTPLDKTHMVRIAIMTDAATVYVDRIELVREAPLATPGGFAFDFGPVRSPVQRQYTGVTPADAWTEARGFGFVHGNPHGLGKTTPYPTRLMGDGLILGDASFRVRLPGGAYRGWAVFDRSGFWEGEQAAYAGLTLLVNGKSVHHHTADPAAAFFQLQDVEALTGEDIADRMVFPRQGEAAFAFKAAAGTNDLALRIEGLKGEAPRLAGLVLAPDTPAGRAFLDAHRKLQRDTILATHLVVDHAHRAAAADRPGPALVVAPLAPETALCPGDWPDEMRDALAALHPPAPRHPFPSRDPDRPKGLNALGMFAHHPALTLAFNTFNGHILFATTLSMRQRELLVLRVAARRGSEYEWAQHVVLGGDAGLTADEISAIAGGPAEHPWSPLDAALLDAVDELLAEATIGDATWATLAAELDEQQLLDVVFTVGAYDLVAMAFRSFGVELDADLRDRKPPSP